MKSNNKKNFFLLVLLFTAFQFTQAQENRFNSELDKFCKTSIKEFKNISKERKVVLDEMANQLARKKYVVFTCKTNSRRTLMLQVWAQTAFYYYSILGKYAFSIGDTITEEALPTYESWLMMVDDVSRNEQGGWMKFLRAWTAEENRHGDLLNKYLYLSGRVDMRAMEISTQYLIHDGFDIQWLDLEGRWIQAPAWADKIEEDGEMSIGFFLDSLEQLHKDKPQDSIPYLL